MKEAQLKTLYLRRQLSMMQIADELQTTHATVLYWLKKFEIPRRSWSESTYVKMNPDGDPFKLPSAWTERRRTLLAAGLLLYWAEGSKKNKTTAAIGNLDGRLLQVFAAFLREVCHVNERRLSVYVRVYKTFSRLAARRYWGRLLGIPSSRIFVYPHTDKRSKTHQQWSRHGLATLEFHNTKFKRWLDEAIEAYIKFLLLGSRSSDIPKALWHRMGGLAGDGPVDGLFSISIDGSAAEF